MKKLSYALCAIVPLALGSAVWAAQPNAPETGAPPAAGEHHHGDRAAWHKDMCTDQYARAAAHLAYVQAKLGLSEQQAAAFDKWRQAFLDQSAKQRAACLETAPKGGSRPTLLDHEAHMEKMLAMKLQTLQATRPALQTLYESLTTEQKAIFEHAMRHMRHGMRGGPGSAGMEGHMGMGHGE